MVILDEHKLLQDTTQSLYLHNPCSNVLQIPPMAAVLISEDHHWVRVQAEALVPQPVASPAWSPFWCHLGRPPSSQTGSFNRREWTNVQCHRPSYKITEFTEARERIGLQKIQRRKSMQSACSNPLQGPFQMIVPQPLTKKETKVPAQNGWCTITWKRRGVGEL